jgi:two-component system response regulator (stage 0 sporulation protein F)
MSTILVVEQEESLRRLYERELAREGDIVLTSENEVDALRELERKRPDVVVLDVGPPPSGDLSAVERMLALDRTIPIVLNTTCRSYADDALAWAVDAYVDKSSDVSELRSKVWELLRSRPCNREVCDGR